MKSRSIFVLAVEIIILLMLSACSSSTTQSDIPVSPLQSSGQIHLYGEMHGVDKILDKEFELWYEYYHNQDMRHLFVEFPYYTAELLNIWMKSDNNDILDAIYSDWVGTASYNPNVKEFYDKIKSQCPETIFHGTDVGHQYDTTGDRFLKYLQSNNLEDSEQYLLTKEAIEQGKYYYRHSDDVYRENMMVKNFTREFDKLSGEGIMGIYGAAHTGLEEMNYTNSVPCMANQLKKRYGDNIHSEDLSSWAKDIEPYRVDTIKVDGKEYDDFVDRPKTQDVLPYHNYPMLIETGQVFVIDYTKIDNSVIRMYYRSDGHVWNDVPTTEEFIVE